jgi:uncharacterized protein (DUF2062 family)
MLFRRRDRLPLRARVSGLLWPRSGFRRAATYVGYRLLRLPGTPYSIAGGFAWGAAVSFTPFIGLHFFLAALFAWATRCSLIASAIGTAIGNPWTFPLIWAWIYACGGWLLGRHPDQAPPLESLQLLFQTLWERVGQAIGRLSGLAPDAVPMLGADNPQLLVLLEDALLPMAVGSLPNVLLVWLAFYFPLRRLIGAYQHGRRGRQARQGESAGNAPDDMPNRGADRRQQERRAP